MKLKVELKKEFYRTMSAPIYVAGYKIREKRDVPAWVVNNINELVEDAEKLINTAIANGRFEIVTEKVIQAVVNKVIRDHY